MDKLRDIGNLHSMTAKYIGAHMPTSGGLDKAVRNGKAIGCTAVQVFTSSPQQWASKPITPEAVQKLTAALAETGMTDKIVSHDSYLINLCAPQEDKRDQSITALARELGRCTELGIPYVVSHIGGHMGQGLDVGLQKAADGIKQVLEQSPPGVTLLMETTAGQGTCLNSRFEEIAKLLDLTNRPANLAVCLDTCHIFAAGYDIRTEEAYEHTFAEFDRLVGCSLIRCLHVNDSKKALGTRVDRHAHLGEGEIGADAFRLLVNDPRFADTIMVVETPEAESNHAANVAKLWAWAQP